jgi:NADH-quinone oxidoreductase subunit G
MADETKSPAAPPRPPGPPSPASGKKPSAGSPVPGGAGPVGPPPPKNPGSVTCTVDGREVVVKPGTNVIEAALTVGIEIPFYCYHKRLSISANCRMCLVEMSNVPGGKLMPACQMPVAEGIAVKTASDRVKEQQRATLEFLLLNHPVDCAICDQAGECKLQDYYMAFDQKPSRLDVPKVEKDKRVRLGPLVTLDQERCILCTRCVRFMREVAEEPQLGVSQRGNHSYITIFPGQPLDSKYAGNTVDICPVGALTSTDFRFRGRVWFMSSARSICTGCARGCNTHLDYLKDTTYRYRPRENEAVNQEWMCDDGRLSYKYLNADRVLAPRQGRGAAGRELPEPAALAAAASALKARAAEGVLAALFSPLASLEDLLAAALVASEGLGLAEVYAGGRPDGWSDDFLKRADENPNRRGLEIVAQAFNLLVRPFSELVRAVEAGKVKAVWAVGAEVPDEAAAAVFGKLETFVCQAYGRGPLAAEATLLLPAAPHSESDGTFVDFEGRAQRFELAYWPRGASRPHWALAAGLGKALGLACRFTTARDVWQELGPRVAGALPGFTWDALPSIQRRRSLVPLAAGTVDGRLPGYRERVPADGSGDTRLDLLKLAP